MKPSTCYVLVPLVAGVLLAGSLAGCDGRPQPAEPPASAAAAPPPLDLEPILRRGLEHGFPALALLVQAPDGTTSVAAAGYADLATERPAAVDDAYHMCSITKQFTAIATLRLIDRGALSFDATLPELLDPEIVGGVPYAERITVRQLLDHSSGIYAFNNDPEYWDTMLGPLADRGIEWTPEELVAFASRRGNEPFHEPGADHSYSDVNYVLLGMIVERRTGRPFTEHVRETLLEPLAMRSTYFLSAHREQPPRGVSPIVGYLVPSAALDELVRIHPMFPRIRPRHADHPDLAPELIDTTAAGERIDAAAGLVTTVEDLHLFGRALFAGELLEPATQSWLMSVADGLASEPEGAYRLGVLRAYHKPYGVLVTAEGDGPGGAVTLLAHHPASGTVIVALTNVFGLFDEADFLLDEIVPALLEAVEVRAAAAQPAAADSAPG